MKDLYLKFTDAAEMRHFLLEFGFEEEYGQLFHDTICLDIVGEIPLPEKEIVEGIFDDDQESRSIPGYHVNLRIPDETTDTSILDPFAISPKTPLRVWA